MVGASPLRRSNSVSRTIFQSRALRAGRPKTKRGSFQSSAAIPSPTPSCCAHKCAPSPLPIARAIVQQKIETCAELGRLAPRIAREFIAEVGKARTLNQIMYAEARAATAYWAGRQCEVKTKSRRWPQHWAQFTTRSSLHGRKKSPRYADHPVNALLNWSYTVVAGRLSVEFFARGACLAIGYLHVDKPGRYSLAYDALELLRPLIDEKVFAFVAKTRFRMGDFLVAPSGQA